MTRSLLSLTAASGNPTTTIAGNPPAAVHLDLDFVGINAENGGGINFGEHLREVGREILSRKGANPIFSESAGEREAFPADRYAPSHACHPERTRGTSPRLVDHTRSFGAQIARSGVPRRLRALGMTPLFNIVIYMGPRARFWRGCEKSKRRSGNFWRVFVRDPEPSCGRLLRAQKSRRFSNFHSR